MREYVNLHTKQKNDDSGCESRYRMTANVDRNALASRRFIAVLEGKDASFASEIVGYARTPEACLAVAARCLDARRWSPSTACGRHIVHPDGFKAVSVLSVADAVRERIVAADAKARCGGDSFIKAIAIDGPAGAGKTSTAKALASRLGWSYIDTGAMYRSVAVAAVKAGVSLDDERAVAEVARGCDVSFLAGWDGEAQRVFCSGEDFTHAIRTPDADKWVTPVSANAKVRGILAARQAQMAGEGECVMEGRDIGSVVAPDAGLKVWLDAAPSERARRRLVQRGGDAEGVEATGAMAEVLADLERRDTADSTRDASPLLRVADAACIDCTAFASADEQAELIALLASKLGMLETLSVYVEKRAC